MATLSYLDGDGKVNFTLVSWPTLNEWLSELNGNVHVKDKLPKHGVNRGKVLEELEFRRKKAQNAGSMTRIFNTLIDKGYGRDWREKRNDQGYTHLEELLIYQPKDWRIQAREYLFTFQYEINSTMIGRVTMCTFQQHTEIDIDLTNSTLVVLFHPEIRRVKRYEPLNFLLAYGAMDPLPGLFRNLKLSPEEKQMICDELSPLDYFFDFQYQVQAYKLELLREIGNEAKFPRLCLVKELDFSDIIGQRMAKQIIREEVVRFIWDRSTEKEICSIQQPLSMIFAGPSGVGKTEMAMWLAKLLNKPNDDAFLKVDCGKLADANELFGMAGAYQGAKQGSALNNFIVRTSQDPDSLGIVLLDEIEKATPGVIHALYQVLDKGEWTNKKLQGEGPQTEVIACSNFIFIMTANSATHIISDQAGRSNVFYTADDADDLEEKQGHLESLIRKNLQKTYPFTDAFIGRIGRIVPFVPMSCRVGERDHPLLKESMTVAKLLIEREQEKLSCGTRSGMNIRQFVSPMNKHKIAKLVVSESIPDAGVRSLQKLVATKMGNRMKSALLVEKGGISLGSTVRYSACEEAKRIDFRVVTSESEDKSEQHLSSEVQDDDDEVAGFVPVSPS